MILSAIQRRLDQRGYYKTGFVKRSLAARLAAIENNIPRKSVLIDIGCNDGTIDRSLIDSGLAARVYGFDNASKLSESHPRLEFATADILTYNLDRLPNADGVLLLNVLHHLVDQDLARARAVLAYLLQRYPFVILDMSSIHEGGTAYWRRSKPKTWTCDEEIWRDLFSAAPWRFKLARYQVGTARRVLWKLRGAPYAPTNLATIARCEGGDGIASCDTVKSPQGDWFRRVTYDASQPQRASLERRFAATARAALDEYRAQAQVAGRQVRVVEPIAASGDNGNLFLHEPDLNAARLHPRWRRLLGTETRLTSNLEALPVREGSRTRRLGDLCRFDVVPVWDGFAACNFRPAPG